MDIHVYIAKFSYYIYNSFVHIVMSSMLIIIAFHFNIAKIHLFSNDIFVIKCLIQSTFEIKRYIIIHR